MKQSVRCIVMVAVVLGMLAGVAGAKTTLTWWGWFPTQEDFAVIKQQFEAKYPDIELQATRLDDYVNKLRLEFSSGAGPDIMSMKDGAMLNQFKPYLVDLKPLLGPWKDQMIESILNDAVAKSGGEQLLVVPVGMSSQMFVYYNATMFEKAGAKVPTNAAEFAETVAALKKAFPDKVTISLGLKDQWFATDFFMMLANMVEPGVTEKADRGEVKWNSEPFVKAMTILRDLVAKDLIPKSSIALAEYEDAIGLFMDGKAIMHGNGSWNVGNLSAKVGDRRSGRATEKDVFGAFMLPNFAGGNPVVIGGMDIGMSVNKNCKNMDAALKLIEFMTVGGGQDYFVGRPGGALIPVKKGLERDLSPYPDKASVEGSNVMIDAYYKNFAASREIANTEVKNQLAIALQNIMNGNDIAQELDGIQKIAERAE